jgi:hypothetical protein
LGEPRYDLEATIAEARALRRIVETGPGGRA